MERPMAERTTADAQLERLLHILPAAAREEGVRLEQLARALGVKSGEVLEDLEEATARSYYHPAGSAEDLQIMVDGGRVRVWTGGEFRRPRRLSPQECLALSLGLRVLAAEADEARRPEIEALAKRLEASVGPASEEAESAGAAWDVEVGNDGFRGVLAEAVRLRRRCRITYLKPGDERPAERWIAPYRLVYDDGVWYLLAHDRGRDGIRVFRLDRVLEAEMTDESFELPADFEAGAFLAEDGRPFRPVGEPAWVRYSPRVARWVRERTGAEPDADGSVTVRHAVADPHWFIRHVLRYGSEAVVLRPPELRERVARAAERIATESGNAESGAAG
jgi:proteasome accessory factor C